MFISKKFSYLSFTLLISACSSPSHVPADYSSTQNSNNQHKTTSSVNHEKQPLSADKNEFINQVASRYQLQPEQVEVILDKARVNQTVKRLMSPKPQGKPIKRVWPVYRNRFIEPIRIKYGQEFWSQHHSTLTAAQKKYGVPAEIIASIIGVETIYGRHMGDFRLLDALYTLGFHHPDSSRPDKHQSFRNQLAALIALHHQGKLNAYSETGSFAGATGLPQFMPISIMHYAVDGDQDGKIDLRHSPKDAIFSVANFLVQHGWVKNMPVFIPAELPKNPQKLVDGGLNPYLTWTELEQAGANSQAHNETWQQGRVLGVIDLKNESTGQHQYRIASQNFFVITQYNHSYFYATAVAELADIIKNGK